MAKIMKLGIIGMSEGNGHPYSWSAIFNGYNPAYMQQCGFPVIPEYLAKQQFPKDGLSKIGQVSHIFTQDKKLSAHIAKASKIETVVKKPEDMIDHVDAILLARDDAANHFKMAQPFLKAGLPIFIDKPLALSVKEAKKILACQQYENQIFTCSSLRFANELILSNADLKQIGKIKFIEAAVMKKWGTYAVHLIEPIIAQIPNRGALKGVNGIRNEGYHQVIVEWENLSAYLKVTGKIPAPLSISFFGDKGSITKTFHDSFSCFKTSLRKFVEVVQATTNNIPLNETMEVIQIIEKGNKL